MACPEWKALAEIRGTTTLLLVEQNASLALGDRATVINNGAIEYTGPSQSLLKDSALHVKLLGM